MAAHDSTLIFEMEAVEGLLPLAMQELEELGFSGARARGDTAAVFRSRLALDEAAARLGQARLAVGFQLLLEFGVPRPKALLGDQHLRRLLSAIRAVLKTGGHTGFRISAAGADSAVFQRLAGEIEAQTGLKHDPADGELLLRVRRQGKGWQVLLRLTPRPLSARSYRVCNMEGGLNSLLAAAMNRLLVTGRSASGSYLNAFCGSGTLLAEWLLGTAGQSGAAVVQGFDSDEAALQCARDNLGWAADRVELFQADASSVNLKDASQDFIAADPPWGDDIGSHEENRRLYPAFLLEASRLLKPGGRLALLSHELKLTRRLLIDFPGFTAIQSLQVWHGGHRPVIWILEKPATVPQGSIL